MFDAVSAYYEAFDVVLEDARDQQPDPAAQPAVDDEEEVVVQVLVLGQWHRTIPSHDTTSCAVPFRFSLHTKRHEALTCREHRGAPAAPMCPLCFTPHEIELAKAADAKAAADEEQSWQDWLSDAPRRAAELETRVENALAKRRTLTTPRGITPLKKTNEGDDR